MGLIWLVPVTGIGAILFAFWLAQDVLRRPAGTPQMQEIAGMIFEGAMAFLRRQYRTIAIMSIATLLLQPFSSSEEPNAEALLTRKSTPPKASVAARM